jgi:hypothetical protein
MKHFLFLFSILFFAPCKAQTIEELYNEVIAQYSEDYIVKSQEYTCRSDTLYFRCVVDDDSLSIINCGDIHTLISRAGKHNIEYGLPELNKKRTICSVQMLFPPIIENGYLKIKLLEHSYFFDKKLGPAMAIIGRIDYFFVYNDKIQKYILNKKEDYKF